MDGNGRWALGRGLPRAAGHRAGVDAVRRAVEAAPELGIGVLTLFAFSADNWRRPPDEVEALMALIELYLERETVRCLENDVRMEMIGRRDRLDQSLRAAIERAEAATAAGTRLRLRIAVDYSARDAILAAARAAVELSHESLGAALGPPVDLLIRTGGERR
ncbi:MAG TPA: polyprenyl diphosphate synthase, partial [Bryobacteraceae bacterium]